MPRGRPTPIVLCLLAVWPAAFAPVPAAAIQPSLDRAGIERALRVARSTDRAREAFHAPYIVHLNDPVVEQIEIVTEFRRMVLIGEDHVRAGDQMFTRSATQAEAALEGWRGLVTIVARLRFNPLNVYVAVPAYDIVVEGGDAAPLGPVSTERTAIFSEPFPGRGRDASRAILGAILEARFEAAPIGQAARHVRIVLDQTTAADAIVDFGRLE